MSTLELAVSTYVLTIILHGWWLGYLIERDDPGFFKPYPTVTIVATLVGVSLIWPWFHIPTLFRWLGVTRRRK